jgi:transcriptional regulator with XRE-family HTH domain
MTFKLYKSYSFIEKDPIIDVVRTAVQDSKLSYTDIHDLSDVSVGTMYNWFHGQTRRPTHAAVAAVLGALGYELTPTRKRAAKVIQLDAERAKRARVKAAKQKRQAAR